MGERLKLRPQQVPKTIKVSTLVISILVIMAIVAAFVTGWAYRGADQERVQAAANALVKNQLKDQK